MQVGVAPLFGVRRLFQFLRRPALTGIVGAQCCATPRCASHAVLATQCCAHTLLHRALPRHASPCSVSPRCFASWCSVSQCYAAQCFGSVLRHSVPHGGASQLALSPALTSVSGDGDGPVSVSGVRPSSPAPILVCAMPGHAIAPA